MPPRPERCPHHLHYLAGCTCCQTYRRICVQQRRHRIAAGTWQPMTDSTGVARRLQALACAGYGTGLLAYHLVVSRENVIVWREQRRGLIRAVTHQIVSYTYERLIDRDGPSTLARSHASERGWHPIDAWDQTTIDNPDAQPYQQLGGWTDWVLLDHVRKRTIINGKPMARFVDLSRSDQRQLFHEHLSRGGSARGFRDRYRPVPIEILRVLAAEARVGV